MPRTASLLLQSICGLRASRSCHIAMVCKVLHSVRNPIKLLKQKMYICCRLQAWHPGYSDTDFQLGLSIKRQYNSEPPLLALNSTEGENCHVGLKISGEFFVFEMF